MSRIQRAADVACRALDKELVLLDLVSGRYFALNATGAAFWQTLGPEGRTLQEMESLLLAQFAVDEGVLHRDLEALVHELQQHGLIRWTE